MSKPNKASAQSPAEIAATIEQRRQTLAATLDEIAVRVHPRTLVDEARSRARSAVDESVGRAYVRVNGVLSGVRGGLVQPDGAPRLERVVPVALLTVGVVGLLVVSARRRGRD